jgi:excisionase family DNA binding protein
MTTVGLLTKEEAMTVNTTFHPEAQRNSLTITELSGRWNCSERTIHRRIDDGTIKSFRLGWRHLIPLSEIERIERGNS